MREAQERFRSAFENAPIGMALMALDGRLFRVNRALAQILGRSGRDLLGASVVDLTHPDDLPDLRASMRCLLSGESPSTQLEQRYLHHDGHPVWIAVERVARTRPAEHAALLRMPDGGHHRATGEWRRARAPGHPRSAHRAAQPHAVRRAARARARARGRQPRARGGAVPRPRPFQGRERQPRALGGRPAAGRGGRPAQRRDAPVRHRRPLRRRRVHGAVPERAVRGDRGDDRRAPDPGDVATGRARGGRGVRDRERRDHAVGRRQRHARDAPAQRRRRDVPRQGAGPRPVGGVRRARAPPRGRQPAHRERAAPRDRARRVAPALPARHQPRRRRAERLRSADPLGAPRARAGATDGVHPARRGDRADRAPRIVGAHGGVPSAQRVARARTPTAAGSR